MKLEQQVCTLEQAKRLKGLGVAQISLFKHAQNSYFPDLHVICLNPDSRDDKWAAFSVAELGLMLPGNHVTLNDEYLSGGRCYSNWIYDGLDLQIPQGNLAPCATEAEARAAILIHLLEIGKVTADEVNARLNS